MGEYRLQSGKILPAANKGAMPSLPEIGSLQKKTPESGTNMPAMGDFNKPDDMPTDVGDTDELLEAMNNIDEWDSYKPSGDPSDQRIYSDISVQFPQEEEDREPTVIRSASSIHPPAHLQEQSVMQEDFELQNDLRSVSQPPMPQASINPPPMPQASINPPPMPQAPAMPSAPQMPSAGRVPAIQAPNLQSAAAVSSELPATTQKVVYIEEEEEEPQNAMSDEEQLQAILASMTPEERDEYEAHCYQERQKEREAQRAKQKELMEMYGTASTQHKSTPKGLIAAIVIVIALAGVGGYFLFTSESDKPAEETKAETAPAEEYQPIAVRARPLNTYTVNIQIDGATVLYVNGVETPMGSAQFVSGRRNSIMAYAPDMVPFFKTFGVDETVSEPITGSLEPDTLYTKGSISFRMTDPDNAPKDIKATFDGRSISNFPQASISDVVLGRPHILILEAAGYGKHMHLIWPDEIETTVTIPELRSANDTVTGTKCMIKKFPASAKPYGLKIATGEKTFGAPVVATTIPGDMIEYHITRDQRQPLQVGIIPDGYGTLSLDTSLLHDSIGKSIVSFTKAGEGDYRVCMRRLGTVMCPSMTEETTVPSGLSWEFFAVEGSETNPRIMRGIQAQELQSSRKYVFETSFDKRNTFKLNQTGYSRIKKD